MSATEISSFVSQFGESRSLSTRPSSPLSFVVFDVFTWALDQARSASRIDSYKGWPFVSGSSKRKKAHRMQKTLNMAEGSHLIEIGGF